jgi:hypothetical protein
MLLQHDGSSAMTKSPIILPSVLLLGLIAVMSCSSERQIDLKSEKYDTFTSVYADLSIAFEMANQDSSVYFPMRDSILKRHDVDTAWVNGITRELGDDPERWLEVWEEITKKLEAKKDSLTP